jgi:Zn finger protein HypA/HybF involved in hydrogenase expression
METTETGKSNTVIKRKREIRCLVCGSIAGKSGKDGAEFICPKCRANVVVDFDGQMLITKTVLREF